jgi:deazaflavin-dependent oxidoreductase (nitroreductase family)
MAKQTRKVSPPKGLSRIFFRFPILLYKIHLGWILGKRFLLLNHTGRKSGLPRKVVLEVVNFDAEKNIYYVSSGFGSKSDWYRNILAQPENTIQIGNKTHKIVAKQLNVDESGMLMKKYAKNYPIAAKYIAKGIGYEVNGSEEDWENLGKQMIFIAFTPL